MSDIDARDDIIDIEKLVKSMLHKSNDKFFSGAEWAALPHLYQLCRRIGLKMEWSLTEPGGHQRDFVLSNEKFRFNVEVDGKSHVRETDMQRDLDLICDGYIIFRVPNKLVNEEETYEELEKEILWVMEGGREYRENIFMSPAQQETDGGLQRYLEWVTEKSKRRKCTTIADFLRLGGRGNDHS